MRERERGGREGKLKKRKRERERERVGERAIDEPEGEEETLDSGTANGLASTFSKA